MPGDTDLLAAALAQHQAGNLENAEQGYRAVLAGDPQQVKAWKMLGVLARDSGRVAQAIDCLRAGLECGGPEPRLYFHLGQAHAAAGDLDGAIRAYRQSLTLVEAEPAVHYALGAALLKRGFRREAIDHFGRSLELDPTALKTHFKLAAALNADFQPGPAEAAYRRLLDGWPDHSPAWSNLGTILQDQDRLDEAIECYRCAISGDEMCVEAHFNLGTALLTSRDFSQSVAAFERVIQLRPEFADAYSRLGDALAAQGQFDTARHQIGRAAAIKKNRLVWALRAEVIGERIFFDNDDIDAYRAVLAERLADFGDSRWQLDFADVQAAGCPPPAALAYQGRDDRQLKAAFASLFAGRLPESRGKRGSGKPRIGFVVTSGHEGIFLRGMAGVLNRLDIRQFEIAVTCGAAAKDQVAAEVDLLRVERMILPADLARAAETLRCGQFDLLYFWEVGTDPINYFLPFLGLAPVQCTSWGWPVTSGIPQIDYFISSDQLEPAGAESHYSEQLVRLAHIPNSYKRPDLGGIVANRARFGFAVAANVYLCPQNPRKFHPDFDGLIGEILRRDRAGVFVMLSATPELLTEQLRARFARHLPDVLDRIRILPRMTKGDFLQLLATADVVLDTPHYGGGANTTYDTLALGQPLVTLAGEFHRGRYSAATCRSIALGELIAGTPEEYVRIANRLGTQAEARRQLSLQITQSAAALFDNEAAVAELQEFLAQAIERHRAG